MVALKNAAQTDFDGGSRWRSLQLEAEWVLCTAWNCGVQRALDGGSDGVGVRMAEQFMTVTCLLHKTP